MNSTTKLKKQYKVLRSDWSNGDLLWLANTTVKDKKVQSCFCYFARGIDKNVISLYPNKEMTFGITIKLPDELLLMTTPRIIQYLELELI